MYWKALDHTLKPTQLCPKTLRSDMIKARSRNPYSVMRGMDRNHREVIAFQFGSPEFRGKQLEYHMAWRAIAASRNQHA
jgi:hypothetical protein